MDSSLSRAGTPEATLSWLRHRFRPEAAAGLAAVIEVELTGPRGGRVCIQVEDGELKTHLGGDAAPHARIVVSCEDWEQVMAGTANTEMLAMEGRIQLEGDLGLAMKMRALFRRVS